MTLNEFAAWLDGYLTGTSAPEKDIMLAKLRKVNAPVAPIIPFGTPMQPGIAPMQPPSVYLPSFTTCQQNGA